MLKNKDVFFFDLDGTLLNIELEEFLKYYFEALSQKFNDLCSDPKKFSQILMAATEKMIKNDGSCKNQEAFMQDFKQKLNINDQAKVEKIKARFDKFYQSDFIGLAKYFDLDQKLPAQIINYLKQKNKRLVLATNPLFPKEAVIARLKWIGIEAANFELITHYENMSYAKPNPNYYQEILTKIDAEPANCLMIGNDLKEDAVATEVGIETIIIEDNLINRKDSDYSISWQGSLVEFEKLIKEKI
ncbi:HAD family hydrolase [Halanaerobium praevalens]|uniref:Haloacid dehalogenase domain protein hydrolase n=1 Tax=Halanaerobium praevalens (strain ATCC 33744 / DSM 2228 / GSL) TaxID=572479 RepID=E3DMQ7_HALPG|nr:HAD family hydrolase [Halanaerobium praevalens]ADO76381.1 Haloacid dehalogenase domain protein hydrolase [Halanaerobium praevalens DSM 2228]